MLTDENKLLELGVESTSNIPFPHIWDLLNENHENHVHELFTKMVESKAGLDIKD